MSMDYMMSRPHTHMLDVCSSSNDDVDVNLNSLCRLDWADEEKNI